jgi:hypothetical protein
VKFEVFTAVRMTLFFWVLAPNANVSEKHTVSIFSPETQKKNNFNIKMDLRETGCEDGRLMALAHDRFEGRALVFTVLKLWIIQLELVAFFRKEEKT